MRLYFGGSPAQIYSKNRKVFENIDKEQALDFIRVAKGKMGVAIADAFLDSEVFFHESILMMELRKRLYEYGIKTSQCYDSLWSNDARLQALCEELLPKVLEHYLTKFGKR